MSILDFHELPQRAKKAFGFIRMKAEHVAHPAKKPPLVNPDKVPATIASGHFPKDFPLYSYAGPAVETIGYRLPDGQIERRPGLVARLVMKHSKEIDGAVSHIEMTASIRDLENGAHPQMHQIAYRLSSYYADKVQHDAF